MKAKKQRLVHFYSLGSDQSPFHIQNTELQIRLEEKQTTLRLINPTDKVHLDSKNRPCKTYLRLILTQLRSTLFHYYKLGSSDRKRASLEFSRIFHIYYFDSFQR